MRGHAPTHKLNVAYHGRRSAVPWMRLFGMTKYTASYRSSSTR